MTTPRVLIEFSEYELLKQKAEKYDKLARETSLQEGGSSEIANATHVLQVIAKQDTGKKGNYSL